jgi:hypothetical protein
LHKAKDMAHRLDPSKEVLGLRPLYAGGFAVS